MSLPRLRVSTIVFLVLVAAAILLANIPGQIMSGLFIESEDNPSFRVGNMCGHGWPFTFLVREPVRVSIALSPFQRLSVWNLGEGAIQWSWPRLMGDVLIGLLVLVVAGMAFERWRRRRGHFQVQLIDLLVAFAVVAGCLSYWATQASERSRLARAVEGLGESLSEHHAQQEYDPEPISWSRGGPTWLRNLLGDRPFAAFDRVIEVHITGDEFSRLPDLRSVRFVRVDEDHAFTSNEELDALRELSELEALDLPYATIADEGANRPDDCCVRLPPMPHLRALNLRDANFRGDGLEYLTSIETLDLGSSKIGDDAVQKLKSLPKLRILSLAGTDVTDAGLEHLKGMIQLRELWLSGSKATAKGIRRLQEALPNCKIK